MPFLNWKSQPIDVSQESAPRWGTRVTIALPPEQRAALEKSLEDCLQVGGKELRVDFPKGWSIFWRIREETGEASSRVLLAHPDPEQWVASVLLEPRPATDFVARYRAWHSDSGRDASLSPNALEGIHRVSNLELVLKKI